MFNQAKSIQLVWFIPSEPPSATKLFEALFGQEPDAFQKVFPPQSPFPVVVQSAVIGEAQHRVQSHIGRIDYFVEPAEVGGIGMLNDPLGHLNGAIERVAAPGSLIGDITRAAVVITFSQKMADRQSVNATFERLFSDKIPFNKDDRDITFQISRRMAGGDCNFNRLLRWTGENIIYQQIGTGNGGGVLSSVDEYYMNYMVDVNTVPSDKQRFNPDQHVELFSKLGDVATELMALERLEDLV